MLSFECIKNEKSVYFLLTSADFGQPASSPRLSCPIYDRYVQEERLPAHLSGQPLLNTLEAIYMFQSVTANISVDSPEFHSQGFQNVHEVRCFDRCFHSMRSSGSDRLFGLRIPESYSDGHNGSSYHPGDGW